MTQHLSFNFDKDLSKEEIARYLGVTNEDHINKIQQAAEDILLRECGNKVYFRGLVEASNICKLDCYYCGIRKFNKPVERYQLDPEDVVEMARRAKDMRYGSFVIQTGERQDAGFVDYMEDIIGRIKDATRCDDLPNGLGITLSVGAQSKETYQRFFDAGAHRFLLRIETTNPDLFAKIHPPEQTQQHRLECLRYLRDIGYQVGTGVMIGLPGQTLDDLAKDIQFFKDIDIDMIGMGPFIPDPSAYTIGGMDMKIQCPPIETRVRLTWLMIAMARITLKDVNIAATTALQTLQPHARERALRFGANVMMPQFTPPAVRKNYKLYPKDTVSEEYSQRFHDDLEQCIKAEGREIGYDMWGDSMHAKKRAAKNAEIETTRV